MDGGTTGTCVYGGTTCTCVDRGITCSCKRDILPVHTIHKTHVCVVNYMYIEYSMCTYCTHSMYRVYCIHSIELMYMFCIVYVLQYLPGAEGLEICECISQGDHKSVYRGTYHSRPVAVKKISDILVNRERAERKDFEKAVEDLKSACHIWEAAKNPNIVSFIGLFNDETEEDGVLLVMELIDQTLETFLKDNRENLTQEKQISLCNQITSGLRYLHNQDPQVIHRDLKSSKILLNRASTTTKIGDLSQAKFRRSDIQYPTPTQSGTAQYMPETCLTDKDDVFSLGVVMLEVVTQEPCCGLEGIVIEKMKSKIPSDHPLKKLILQCLEDNPDDRPATTEIHSQILRLCSSQQRDEVSKHTPDCKSYSYIHNSEANAFVQ